MPEAQSCSWCPGWGQAQPKCPETVQRAFSDILERAKTPAGLQEISRWTLRQYYCLSGWFSQVCSMSKVTSCGKTVGYMTYNNLCSQQRTENTSQNWDLTFNIQTFSFHQQITEIYPTWLLETGKYIINLINQHKPWDFRASHLQANSVDVCRWCLTW